MNAHRDAVLLSRLRFAPGVERRVARSFRLGIPEYGLSTDAPYGRGTSSGVLSRLRAMVEAGVATAEIQESIRTRVQSLGGSLGRMGPKAMLVVLGGAALWPIVAPLLGTGAAVGVIGGAVGLLRGPGEDFISDFLRRVAMHGGGRVQRSETEVRAELERELLARLEADDEATGLREDLSRLLQTVGGVEVALRTAVDEVKEALARGLAELGGSWGEFRWMLVEVQETIHEIQTRQVEVLALQREQLDLQREQLVKTNLLIGVHTRQLEAPAPAEERAVEELAPAFVTCPYKGLEAFQSDDAGYFFGREQLVAELLARLAESPFLAVVGASGSGKSSLLRAGVVPELWAGALPGSKDWLARIMTPREHPLEELAIRVSLLRGIAAGSLLADLRSDPQSLGIAIRQALLEGPPDARVVLVIDQFEELFTLCRDEQERRLFLEAVIGGVAEADNRAVVIVVVRADFYGRLAQYAGFPAAVGDHQVLVGPMSAQELARAIEQPALAAGLSLEPGLAEVMIRDLAGEPGVLPLLSHALLETWKRRRGRILTVAGYLESGGVREAIARTADRVFAERLSPAQRLIAREVFFRLTEPGEGTEDTRRRATLEDLVPRPEEAPAVEAVVKVLADERLLTTADGSVEVAHEALIRHWPALRSWLDEDRAGLRTHRRLTEATEEWERLARDDGALYRGLRLEQATDWLARHPASANNRERAFIEASVAARDRARRRNRRRITAVVTLLLLGLAVSTAAALIAVRQQHIAVRQQHIAESQAIAVTAENQLPLNHPQLGLLLAIQAAHKARTAEATHALRLALLQPRERLMIPHAADYMALSRDGRTLLTLTNAATSEVSLWNTSTGRRRAEIAPPGALLAAAALSPSGRLVATADTDMGASTWTSKGRLLGHQPGSNVVGQLEGPVGEAPFGPREQLIVTSDGDGTATIWDPTTGRRHRLLHARAAISNARFSPDGRYVAATTGNRSEVWNAATGRRIAALAGAAPRFSPDGRRLLTLAGKDVKVWSLPGVRQVAALSAPADPTEDFATFSQDGRYVLTLSPGGVRVFVASDGRRIPEPPAGLRVPVGEPAFSPDGRFALDGDQLISVTTGETVARFPPAAGPSISPVFSPDGSSIVTADDTDVRVWATPGWRAGTIGSGASQVISVAATRNGWVAAATDGPGAARVWHGEVGTLGSKAPTPAGPRFRAANVALSPDGQYAAALTLSGNVDVWHIAPWRLVGRLTKVTDRFVSRGVAFPPSIAISQGGSLFGLKNETASPQSPAISIWDVSTGRRLYSSFDNNGSAGGDELSLSQDGRLAATATSDGVTIWNPRTGRRVTTLRNSRSELVPAIAFSHDDRRIVTTTNLGNAARVSDARSGKSIAVLRDNADVLDGAFSADDRFVTTVNSDGTLRVWEADTGRAVGTLPVHVSPAAPPGDAVAFSAHGHTVITGGKNVIHAVECEVCRSFDQLLNMAERRALRPLTPQESRLFLH